VQVTDGMDSFMVQVQEVAHGEETSTTCNSETNLIKVSISKTGKVLAMVSDLKPGKELVDTKSTEEESSSLQKTAWLLFHPKLFTFRLR